MTVPATIDVLALDLNGMALQDGMPLPESRIARIESSEACAEIMSALRDARSSKEHSCIDAGSLVLHFTDGKEQTVRILPGHVPTRYEFRFSRSLYSLSRKNFFEALMAGGVEISKMPQ